MKREIRRKGFTPVELLIVIVVIGILSAMMMISSSEAVASAKATNLIKYLQKTNDGDTKDDGSARTQEQKNQQYIYMWIR